MSRFFIALTPLFAFAFSGVLPAGELAAQQQHQQADHTITGTITEVDENEVTLRTDDQQSITVMLDEQTSVLGNAGERVGLLEGELRGLLDSGQQIVVNYRTGQGGEHTAVSIEKWTAELAQAQRTAGMDHEMDQDQGQQRLVERTMQNSITGTITELDENEVTVRTDDQQSMTVTVDEQTRILDEEGERVEALGMDLLGNLDSGDRVVVNLRSGEGTMDRVATSIEIRGVEAQQAQQREVEMQEREVQAQQRQEERAQEFQQQDELPGTSSALPLIAFLGLMGVVGAGALSVAARREH